MFGQNAFRTPKKPLRCCTQRTTLALWTCLYVDLMLTLNTTLLTSRAHTRTHAQNRIISWSYKLPNDLAWVPGLIEGSGVNPSTFPPNLGQLPLVYSDPKAMHLLLQVHFRINTTLLMLHRPFSHACQSDITALNASHSIVTVVVMVVQTSRSRGDPTMMLRRRQLWVVLYGALCLMGYQACLYPIEPCVPTSSPLLKGPADAWE